MVRSSKTYPGNPWRIFYLLQSRRRTNRWKILSRTLLAHCPPSDPQCEWWCYQSSLTAISILGSTVWPARLSNTSEIRPTLRATPRARSKLLQIRSRRSPWKYTYSSTLRWSTSYYSFILLRIPELAVQTIHQFLFFQISNTALALPDPSLKILLVPATEPFVGLGGCNIPT